VNLIIIFVGHVMNRCSIILVIAFMIVNLIVENVKRIFLEFAGVKRKSAGKFKWRYLHDM
jgi:hypothetical protein